MDAEKQNAPAGEAGAGETLKTSEIVSTGSDSTGQPDNAGKGEASNKGGKAERWFPIAPKDLNKIRMAHLPARADRLQAIWCELLSLANRFQKNEVSITLDRLASNLRIGKRQTCKEALLDLERLKMIRIKKARRGIGGKFETSKITVKPSVAVVYRRSIVHGENHVRFTNAKERTVNNNTSSLREEEVGVIKKETPSGFHPGLTPDGAPVKPSSFIEEAMAALEEYK